MNLIVRFLLAVFFVCCIQLVEENNKSNWADSIAAERATPQFGNLSSSGKSEVPQFWVQAAKAEIEKREYVIKPVAAHYAAFNRKNNFTFSFRKDGYSVANTGSELQPPWNIDFQVKGITSHGGNPKVEDMRETFHAGSLLEYRYPNHTIQYKNDESGVRQNFIVDKDLAGSGSLQVIIHTEGDLNPVQQIQNG